MSDANRQLQKLMSEGLSMEEAAASLGFDVDGAGLALQSLNQKEVSTADLIKTYQPRVVNILFEIAQLSDNDSARVKACEIILNGKGVLPELNASQVAERFAAMKRAVALVEKATQDMDSVIELKSA